MKKGITLLTGSLLTLALHVSAQFKPGTLMLGSTLGSTTYTSGNSDYSYDNGNTRSISNKAYSLTAGPQLGVFVSPNLGIGGTHSVNVTDHRCDNGSISSGV